MLKRMSKIIPFGKFTFVCIIMLLILLIELDTGTQFQGKKCFDLTSAMLISIGISTAITLGINSREKV